MTDADSDSAHPEEAPPTLRVTRAARRRPGLWLIAIVLLSLALHGALAAAVWQRPLGFLGIERADEPAPQVMRVRRASYDYYLRDATQTPTQRRDTDDELSAADVSRALLANQPMDQPADPAPPPDTPRLLDERRSTSEPRASADAPQLAADEGLYQSLIERDPADLTPTVSGSGSGQRDSATGDGSDGARGGTGSPGEGEGAAQARALLGQSGAVPDVNPEPPDVDDAPLPQARPLQDKRLLEPGPTEGAITLGDRAFVNTQKLRIPEHLDRDFNYYLSRYDPPDGPGYFRVDIAARQSLNKLPAMAKDVIFLIDTSDSMSDRWVDQVVEGVKQSLPTLNRGDRFNLVFFNEQPRFFSTSGMKPVNPDTLNAARQFLEGTRSQGYTNVNAALRQLLVRNVEPDRVYEIILLSDGKPTRGVMDTRQLINLITRDNQRVASIYCIGVGDEQNRELLDFLAYRNKGFSRFITSRGEAPGQIGAVMNRLRYPLIKNVQLSATGVDESRVYPRFLPNIHEGQTLSVFGRFQRPKTFTMRLTGRAAGKKVDFTFTRDLSLASPDDRQIAEGWAFWKLHHLYSEIIRRGRSELLQNQIDRLQEKYDVSTVY